MPDHDRRCGGHPLVESGDLVRPDEEGKAGDQRGTGEVVEEQVAAGSPPPLLRAAPPRWPCGGCPRRAGRSSRCNSSTPGTASICWMSCVGPVTASRSVAASTTGSPATGVRRSRARPFRCNSVPSPPGQDISMVEVRRTEPGRRAGGVATGSLGAGARSELTGDDDADSLRKSCFQLSHASRTVVPFRTTLLTNMQVKG